MGHLRLGDLPKTRRWKQVVALLGEGASTDAIASATLAAASKWRLCSAKVRGFQTFKVSAL